MSTWPEQAEVSKQINEEFTVFPLEKLGGKVLHDMYLSARKTTAELRVEGLLKYLYTYIWMAKRLTAQVKMIMQDPMLYFDMKTE